MLLHENVRPYVKLRPLAVLCFLPLEPCAPTDLSITYNMSAGLAQVTWMPARGARNYSVQAVTDRGLTDACNTTGGSCFLHGLQCGQIYNVTVKAHNMACDDVTSESHRLMTGTFARPETFCRLNVYNHSHYMLTLLPSSFRALPAQRGRSQCGLPTAECHCFLGGE